MKKIILITTVLLHQILGYGQIIGNRTLVSKTLEYELIESVEVQMYANITIDAMAKGIKIEAESSIINHINFNYSGTSLTIDQKEWIEPTMPITITIGAPDIKSIKHDTWDETTIINLDAKSLSIQADIGTVTVSGSVQHLVIKSIQGKIVAKDLQATTADIQLGDNAQATVNVKERVICNVEPDARLTFVNTPQSTTNCQTSKDPRPDVKYIDFTIQNNSWSRRHFVVVGPKPDGRSFSYGFPLMPGQKKSERWTTGTKIYKKGVLGKQTLLVTIDAEDEGQLVKLFEKD